MLTRRCRRAIERPACSGVGQSPNAAYTAFPSDGTVALISCLPSPCTRLSRALTTTETPPLSRDVTGLGGVPIHIGARLEVPVFTSRTLGVAGGQLYPWQYRSPTTRDKSATPRGNPRYQFVRSRQTGSRCKIRPKGSRPGEWCTSRRSWQGSTRAQLTTADRRAG